jgi:hypothetical protein
MALARDLSYYYSSDSDQDDIYEAIAHSENLARRRPSSSDYSPPLERHSSSLEIFVGNLPDDITEETLDLVLNSGLPYREHVKIAEIILHASSCLPFAFVRCRSSRTFNHILNQTFVRLYF